jgi:hypothetical protein
MNLALVVARLTAVFPMDPAAPMALSWRKVSGKECEKESEKESEKAVSVRVARSPRSFGFFTLLATLCQEQYPLFLQKEPVGIHAEPPHE